MTASFRPVRRHFVLGAGAALAAVPFRRVRAAEATPLAFQLSWIKSIQYGGYFAAMDQGYYGQNGLAMTFNSGGPNMDAIANVASGQNQLGDRPVGALVIARDKGVPVKVIGNVFQKSPYCIMSLASKPLRTVKDFAGKTIAVPVSSRPLMLYLLRQAGLDDHSVNIVPAAPDPSALVTGQIDGYSGYSTNQGVMLQTRGVEIFALNVQDLGMPETVGVLYGREDWLPKNRETVVRFLKASIAGWKWALANPDETAHLMVDKYGAPGLNYTAQDTEIKASKPYVEATTKGLLSLDMPTYDEILKLYRETGLIKSNITAAEFCDPSYVQEALG